MGARGARTRQAIREAALRCFEAKGFHASLVDDIADAAGVSRAGVYQYFESKEQIFLDLAGDGGAALMEVVDRLGPLGPTAEGYENLRAWLGDLAGVHDRYRAIYLQWAAIGTPPVPVRPFLATFIESYVRRMAMRLPADVDEAPDVRADESVALLAILLRVNDFRQMGIDRGRDDEQLLDAFATFVQLALFPSTPNRVLVPRAALAAPEDGGARTPRTTSGRGRGRRQPDPDRFGGGSARVLRTVQRLLDAGATVFADQGYHASSVEDIRREAGLSRGTFYKYFDDTADLLVTLAEDCAARLEGMVVDLGAAVQGDDGAAGLRGWLLEFLRFHRRYRSVFHAWAEQDPVDPRIAELGAHVGESVLLAFDDLLGRVERGHPFDVRAGSLVLLAMLDRVPGYALGTVYDMADERLVQVLAAFIERGLLGERPAVQPSPAR